MPNPKPEIDVEGLLAKLRDLERLTYRLGGWALDDLVAGIVKDVHALRSLHAANAELQATATVCACTLTASCKPSCSCANSYLSGGCNRCATYGSEEQRKIAASAIAEREKANAELVADRERLDWMELHERVLCRNQDGGWFTAHFPHGSCTEAEWVDGPDGESIRSAIDAARAARTTEGGEK